MKKPLSTSIFTVLFEPIGVIQPCAMEVRHGTAYISVSRSAGVVNVLFVYQLAWAVGEEKPVRPVFRRVANKIVMHTWLE